MIKKKFFKIELFATMLLSVLVISCSKDDDNNEIPESNEVQEEQEQVIMDNAAKVENDIMTIFENAKSAEKMGLHLDEMKAMKSVEDAWIDDGSISVKIKDGGIISWYFFPENEGQGNVVSGIRKASANKTRATEFALCGKKNSCIVNTIPYDASRECNNELDYIADMLGEKGYGITNAVEGEAVTVDFLCKKLPNYGVSVLFTHGDYKNGQHWIMTGTTYDATETEHFYEKQDYADHWPGLKYFFQDWKSNNAQLWVMTEKRNNRYVNVTYLAVSETYLKNKISKSFPDNSLMFAIACCALKNNPSLWNVFKDKGLGCFFGYDDYVYPDTGIDGLYYLMDTMLEEFSTASEGYGIIKQGKVDNRSGAHLKYYPDGSNVCLMSLCPDNNHPHAIDLGLPSGTKWACCNVGAFSPEGYGGYYAWGETSEKSSYTWDTYKYYDANAQNRYIDIGVNISGTQYDAARVNWGASWRMPTANDVQMLFDNCSCSYYEKCRWSEFHGIKGVYFTGPNGNKIFMPAAGQYWDVLKYVGNAARYWTGTIWGGNGAYYDATDCDIQVGHPSYSVRAVGYSIRPVSN